MQEQGTISIHTDNIFPIIKKALYSERDIFLRELVSNAVDAISKLKMVSYAGETNHSADPEITITINKAPDITSSAPPAAKVGTAYSHTFTATGYPAPTFST